MINGTLPQVSNAETWQVEYTFYDDDDGEPFDLGDVTAITLKVRDPSTQSVCLSGSLGTEIQIVGDDADGTIQWTFTSTAMSDLDAKTYEASLLITADGITTQIFLGHLPVLDGF